MHHCNFDTSFPIFMASWSHAFWESVVSICCKLRNHQSMIVIDLRGKDRASGAIPGTAIIPAMDLLKEIGKYVKDFGPKSFTYFPISLRLWHFSASIQLTELPPWLDVSPFESNTFSSVKVASGDERPI